MNSPGLPVKKCGPQALATIFDDTVARCRGIMQKKNNDYTGGTASVGPFANFEMAGALGVDPVVGICLRIGDKLQRIRSFTQDGSLKVESESVYDACEDIINYAILAKAMLMERRGELPPDFWEDRLGELPPEFWDEGGAGV